MTTTPFLPHSDKEVHEEEDERDDFLSHFCEENKEKKDEDTIITWASPLLSERPLSSILELSEELDVSDENRINTMGTNQHLFHHQSNIQRSFLWLVQY